MNSTTSYPQPEFTRVTLCMALDSFGLTVPFSEWAATYSQQLQHHVIRLNFEGSAEYQCAKLYCRLIEAAAVKGCDVDRVRQVVVLMQLPTIEGGDANLNESKVVFIVQEDNNGNCYVIETDLMV